MFPLLFTQLSASQEMYSFLLALFNLWVGMVYTKLSLSQCVLYVFFSGAKEMSHYKEWMGKVLCKRSGKRSLKLDICTNCLIPEYTGMRTVFGLSLLYRCVLYGCGL